MARNLKIRDLTLRDGQQSSFATRMNQEQIDRCLPFYKDANFYAMEVWGGAVPDSVMRYLDENPWTRLETIHKAVGDVSKLTALSRGRNLFGYSPYTDEIIDGFCRNSIRSGLGIMRIFDALNDVDNVKSNQIRQAVRRHRRLCGLLHRGPEIPRTGFLGQADGQIGPQTGLHRRLFPRQGPPDGRTGRRHDHHQGHVGSDSAAPRRHAGAPAEEEPFGSRRFPYPLHAGLRTGFGAFGHHRRGRRRGHQLLVLRRRHGRPGHRADPCFLQEAGHRNGL